MKDFGNAKSIEIFTTLRIHQATDAVKAYHDMAAKIKAVADSPSHALDPAALYMYYQAHLAENQAMDAQRQLDKLRKSSELDQQHDQKRDAIDLEHAYDWRLDKEKQITEERRKQHQLNAEDARFTGQSEGYSGNSVARPGFLHMRHLGDSAQLGTGAAGSSTQATKDALADATAAKDLADLQEKSTGRGGGGANDEKSKEEELRRIHEEAVQSALRGSAL